MMSLLSLYDAAAGSGKTHALVVYYLQRTLLQPDHLGGVLAITFTNKATQEMKTRIIAYLNALATNSKSPLGDYLQKSTGLSHKGIQERAHYLLGQVLHHYDDFEVTTIDSFFNRLIGLFSLELHIEPAYTLALDTTPIIENVVALFFETLPSEPMLYRTLAEWSMARLQKGQHWNPTKEITKLAQVLLQKQSRTTTAIPLSQSATHFAGYKKEADAITEVLAEKAHALLGRLTQEGIPATDFLWGKQGLWGYLKKLQEKKEALPSSRIAKATQSHWLKKSAAHYQKLLPFLETEGYAWLTELVEYHKAQLPFLATYKELSTVGYVGRVVERLQQLLDQAQKDRHQLMMPYLPTLLGHLLKETPSHFWDLKVKEPYYSLLVDEFQDVSQSQWQNMAPFLKNTLEKEAGSLLVGDIKQALYRWRGGDPKIFLTEVEKTIGKEKIERQPLPYNWRSAPDIIAFNNDLFHAASQYLYTTLKEKIENEVPTKESQALLLEEVKQIPQAYQYVAQKVPPGREEKKGYIEVHWVPPKQGEEEKWQTQAIARTLEKIETLQENGYAAGDIALLVRDHLEAQRLVDAILAQKINNPKRGVSYEVLTASGIRLQSHPAIALLVAALHYLAMPEDPATLVDLVHLYQKRHNPKKESPHDYFSLAKETEKLLTYLPKAFVEERKKLAKAPLGHMIVSLIAHFGLNSPHAAPYLTFLQEQVHRFPPQDGLHAFVLWWEKEKERLRLPTSGNANSMTITTIHQSKGLAYPIVIVPFCAWRLDHPPHAAPLLWSQSPSAPFSALGEIPLYYKQSLHQTAYHLAYYQEQWQVYLEQLNLLYVAFTRPIAQLYVMAPQTLSPPKSPKHVGHILEHLLRKQYKVATTQDTLQLGEFVPCKKAPPTKKAPLTQEKALYSSPSLYEGATGRLQALPDEVGTWWHALWEEIETWEDIPRLLSHGLRAGRFTTEEVQKVEEKVKLWKESPYLRDWLSGRYQVKNENTLVTPEGKLWRPDRVMIEGKKAIVVDFKTGAQGGAHGAQVRGYMERLRKMGYQEVEGYLFYIEKNKIQNVKNKA